MSGKVVLKGCGSYERPEVERTVGELFEALGGPGTFASEGQSVFLKVNALLGAAPEKGVTTHPEVVRAVVRQFQSVTDRITIGDSPGGPFTPGYLKRVYEKTGFAEVASDTGAELSLDTSTASVQIPGGKVLKTIMICGAMHSSDCLVSVSKFKTHMFLNMSGAIKNLFGTVPGANKFTYHSRFPKDSEFSDLIVDVLLASAPDLHVMDAVVAMDGNGPRVGNVIDMGMMAAGTDAFALDLAMMDVIGIEPEKNKALAAGIRRGLCSGDLADVEMLGDGVESLRYSGFRLPDKKDISERVPDFVMKRFGERMALRPVPVEGKCTACKKCVEICPASAITIEGKLARVDQKKCQRCYCCHELCEQDAIVLERPLLMKLMRINRDL
ncbi:MAG TPA: DUF362 domain-containing protein [Candidatus Anoxymicrobiaceae bacterium]|jgi:uncharacterized protein (DUF362 family)/Pyruvate/2-oxoacid:ferredoxin oxidoreductase delta subunit